MTTTHAARYHASEFLPDRHPDLSPPFPKEVIAEEISIAYGRRHVPKLVDVIGLDDAKVPDEEKARALRYLLSLLTNQETKSEVVTYGAAPFLVHLLLNKDPYVRELTCKTLSSIAQLMQGRAAIVEAKGIPALTASLADENLVAREAASECMEALSSGADGAVAVLQETPVLPAVVRMLHDENTTPLAILAGVGTLCNCTTNDNGIYQALDAQVPPIILKLATTVYPEEKATQLVRVELKTACGRCLRNLCHHLYGKVQTHEAGAIPVLTSLLQDPDELVKQQAAAAMMGLTLEEDAKLPTIQAASKDLVALLHHMNPDVAENVLSTIQNACEHPKAREIIEGLLDESDMDYVFGL
mmetsp:Transcript_12184/g.14541  ORF Transcript_12184/g.14541 Transcript_12184/m.14541 type:complete len:357 (-) Transcript_12184:227-1297(-)|eukprot:CAMPEP_0197848122 /NCGR_PEP_ID=MMETSP1438-20131217/7936_1 /TAXON_ID=1461541 /ORGANISM="Pterosperma sp., Strain CCMP1384" /LENGTH=356 /DNA_ID=CAMNT_0043460257 /DNA_START=322 /DNA_END=1392 /DNA_ORIENTATION=+